jgi:hypothetical protein
VLTPTDWTTHGHSTSAKLRSITALPRVEEGLRRYLWLQARVADTDGFPAILEFRGRFNRFYRVRRGAAARRGPSGYRTLPAKTPCDSVVVKFALAHAAVGSASGRTCQTALHFWQWQIVIVVLAVDLTSTEPQIGHESQVASMAAQPSTG